MDSSESLPQQTATISEHHHYSEPAPVSQFSQTLPHTSFDNPTPCSSYIGSEDSPNSFDSFLSAETPSSFLSGFDEPIDLEILRACGEVFNGHDSVEELFTGLLPPVINNPLPTPSASTNPSPMLQKAPLPPPVSPLPPSTPTHTPPNEKTKSTASDRAFHCDHPGCDKSYPRPCDLKKHKKRHRKPFPCRYAAQERCESAFSTTKERDRHEKSKHRREDHLVCVACGHTTARKDNMTDHIKRRHGEEDKDRAMAMILGL